MAPLLRTFVILAFASLPILAQPAPAPRDSRIARALDLTDAQKASIHAIREKHRPDMSARRDAVRQARLALRTALQDPAAPEAQLRALNDEAASARFEMLMAGRALRQEVQAVLTPEQRAKADEWRAATQARRQERMRHLHMAMGMAG